MSSAVVIRENTVAFRRRNNFLEYFAGISIAQHEAANENGAGEERNPASETALKKERASVEAEKAKQQLESIVLDFLKAKWEGIGQKSIAGIVAKAAMEGQTGNLSAPSTLGSDSFIRGYAVPEMAGKTIAVGFDALQYNPLPSASRILQIPLLDDPQLLFYAPYAEISFSNASVRQKEYDAVAKREDYQVQGNAVKPFPPVIYLRGNVRAEVSKPYHGSASSGYAKNEHYDIKVKSQSMSTIGAPPQPDKLPLFKENHAPFVLERAILERAVHERKDSNEFRPYGVATSERQGYTPQPNQSAQLALKFIPILSSASPQHSPNVNQTGGNILYFPPIKVERAARQPANDAQVRTQMEIIAPLKARDEMLPSAKYAQPLEVLASAAGAKGTDYFSMRESELPKIPMPLEGRAISFDYSQFKNVVFRRSPANDNIQGYGRRMQGDVSILVNGHLQGLDSIIGSPIAPQKSGVIDDLLTQKWPASHQQKKLYDTYGREVNGILKVLESYRLTERDFADAGGKTDLLSLLYVLAGRIYPNVKIMGSSFEDIKTKQRTEGKMVAYMDDPRNLFLEIRLNGKMLDPGHGVNDYLSNINSRLGDSIDIFLRARNLPHMDALGDKSYEQVWSICDPLSEKEYGMTPEDVLFQRFQGYLPRGKIRQHVMNGDIHYSFQTEQGQPGGKILCLNERIGKEYISVEVAVKEVNLYPYLANPSLVGAGYVAKR